MDSSKVKCTLLCGTSAAYSQSILFEVGEPFLFIFLMLRFI